MTSVRTIAGACVAVLFLLASAAPRAQSTTPTLSFSVNGTTVTLNWTPAAGATSYELIVAGIASPIAVGNVLTYATTAPPGFYDVQVRGRAGSVVGPLSNLVTIPVAVSTPAPTNLAGILSGNGALLTWDLPASTTGLTGMALQLLSGPGGGVVSQGAIPLANALRVTGIPPGTYTARVVGTGPAGLSTPSNAVTFTSPGCSAAGPIPLTINTSGLVSIQWPAVPGATGYQLDVASTPGGPLIASYPFPASQTSLSASAAIGTYYVTLSAPLACGTTARSAERTVSVTQGNPVDWTREQWRAWFFNLVASRGLPNATLSSMQALRGDLLAVGADWQNGWRGDLRARIYLPVPNCPPPSSPTAPACSYTRAVDVGENGVGAPWSWVPRY
jgi:hypothetical protein